MYVVVLSSEMRLGGDTVSWGYGGGGVRATAAQELLTTSRSPDDINLHHGEEALRPP